ncbi:MAG: hypothetical protein Q4D81_08860 [Eubacteriales bacterium]|nr:hypothetical protein [Eubacteriales bacterium]
MGRFKQICSSTDLYAMTAVLYRCVTGNRLTPLQVTGLSPLDIRKASLLEGCPETVISMLQSILKKGLSVSPRRRWLTAGEMLVDLTELEDRITGKGITHWALWGSGRRRLYQTITDNTALDYIVGISDFYHMNERVLNDEMEHVMEKKNIFKSVLSIKPAKTIVFVILAASMLSACAAASTKKDNTSEQAAQNAAVVETENSTPVDSTPAENASGDKTSVESRAGDTASARRILEEYAGTLDTLYGKTYTAYMWSMYSLEKNEFGRRLGFDTTEIPATDAAYRIDDYDQDGTEELLVVSVNDDSTMKFTMYEVTDEQKISPADTYTSIVKWSNDDIYVYAAEQGKGTTDVFVYDKGGPCIGIDCSGFGYQATGRLRTIFTVKYDGNHFVEEGEPYVDRTSGDLYALRFVRKKLESFGTVSLIDEDIKRIFMGSGLTKYLPDVHEIMRTYTTVLNTEEPLTEGYQDGSDGKIGFCYVHFAEENELYSTEINERFSNLLSDNFPRELSFCEEDDNEGTVSWWTGLSAFGKDGNLYSAGYNYINRSQEAREKGIIFENNTLNLYFWETEEGIYLLPEMSEEERTALLDEGILPEKAALAYSESEIPDTLDPSEEGDHHSIEIFSNGNVCYSGYNLPGKDREARDCVTIIWKKGIGLIAYQYSRTAAGEGLVRVWDSNSAMIKDSEFKTW